MPVAIGIRREDKNKWERRTPLTPAAVATLAKDDGVRCVVQPSPIRVFPDDEYRRAGAEVSEDLSGAQVVLAVKEVPSALLMQGKTYVYFSHVIKGQKYNMPMLKRLMELGCTLIDYERITDDANRRLIFFGVQAGQAGMIETLRALGRRLQAEGMETPLANVRHAFEYRGLRDAKEHLKYVGVQLQDRAAKEKSRPLVIGVAGYGNVSRGVQDILDCLPLAEVKVADLAGPSAQGEPGSAPVVKVVFKEEHMVEAIENRPFELKDYYEHPERYRGTFERHLPHLDLLVNTIFWDTRYPRLVTRDWVQRNYQRGQSPRLRVIGDISCDIEGSIEVTLKSTEPDAPCYVYDPETDRVAMGVEGHGPVIMAVDNLPCELPTEASEQFSRALSEMAKELAAADWSQAFASLRLSAPLKRAVIVHHGQLTPSYEYLEKHLRG